jgi:hypothetical protein
MSMEVVFDLHATLIAPLQPCRLMHRLRCGLIARKDYRRHERRNSSHGASGGRSMGLAPGQLECLRATCRP